MILQIMVGNDNFQNNTPLDFFTKLLLFFTKTPKFNPLRIAHRNFPARFPSVLDSHKFINHPNNSVIILLTNCGNVITRGYIKGD